jgi:hypothetical protein
VRGEQAEQGRQIAEVAELGDIGGVAGDDSGRVVVEPGRSAAGSRAGDCLGIAALACEREIVSSIEEAGSIEDEVSVEGAVDETLEMAGALALREPEQLDALGPAGPGCLPSPEGSRGLPSR